MCILSADSIIVISFFLLDKLWILWCNIRNPKSLTLSLCSTPLHCPLVSNIFVVPFSFFLLIALTEGFRFAIKNLDLSGLDFSFVFYSVEIYLPLLPHSLIPDLLQMVSIFLFLEFDLYPYFLSLSSFPSTAIEYQVYDF